MYSGRVRAARNSLFLPQQRRELPESKYFQDEEGIRKIEKVSITFGDQLERLICFHPFHSV